MSSGLPERRVLVTNLMYRIRITAMNPLDAATTRVFEAMKIEAAFVDWLGGKEAIHHNNYRALFEAGALEPFVEFRAKREIVQGAMEKAQA
jgi:hypothetical protein